MKRTKLNRALFVCTLAVLALACGETVGGMMQDAGTMLADAGSMMQPDAGAQDVSASCNKSGTHRWGGNADRTVHWAEFEVTPGTTEVTVCHRQWEGGAPPNAVTCHRSKATWIRGTSTGVVQCSADIDYDDPDTDDIVGEGPVSITVHN
jgi:hypothetical protein